MAAKRHGKGSFQGHHEMSSHADPVPGKDKVTHSTHHAQNKEHGLDQGMAPEAGYEGGELGDSHLGGNEEHC